jgi:hypothetical protein
MGGRQMNVTGGGINMGMTQQGLHHGQINASFRQRGAERVAQRVGVAGDDSRLDTVIAKDGVKARRRERCATSRPFATTNNVRLLASGRSAS